MYTFKEHVVQGHGKIQRTRGGGGAGAPWRSSSRQGLGILEVATTAATYSGAGRTVVASIKPGSPHRCHDLQQCRSVSRRSPVSSYY